MSKGNLLSGAVALNEYAQSARTTYSGKERERNAHHQGTGTGDDEESEGTI